MISKVAGDIGTAKRELSRMLQEASERQDVRNYALAITSGQEDQISAVYNSVKEKVRYQPDPAYNELFIAPHRMIEMIKADEANGTKNAAGDCDDIGLFCAALYRVLGYKSVIVILDQDGGWNHAASEVYSEKIEEWIFIDPTSPLPKGMIPEFNKRMEIS